MFCDIARERGEINLTFLLCVVKKSLFEFMEPRKQKAAEKKPVMPTAIPSRVTRSMTMRRVTRSMTRQGKAKLVVSPLRFVRKTKKAKMRKKRKNAKPEEKPQDSVDENAEEEEKSAKEGGTKSAEQEEEAGDSENENKEKTGKEKEMDDTNVSVANTIIIENW